MDCKTRVSQHKRIIHKLEKQYGRAENSCKILAVTKMHSLDEILPLVDCNLLDWGENQVQELIRKQKEMQERNLCLPIRWHMIGTLQKNKIKLLRNRVYRIHSVDSLSLAEALDRDAEHAHWHPSILLQVNISGEKSKHGMSPEFLRQNWDQFCGCSHLNICGLMTMAPREADQESCLKIFHALAELAQDLSCIIPFEARERVHLDELSMGMSRDYEAAVEAGSTWLRLGTALLGARSSSSDERS